MFINYSNLVYSLFSLCLENSFFIWYFFLFLVVTDEDTVTDVIDSQNKIEHNKNDDNKQKTIKHTKKGRTFLFVYFN